MIFNVQYNNRQHFGNKGAIFEVVAVGNEKVMKQSPKYKGNRKPETVVEYTSIMVVLYDKDGNVQESWKFPWGMELSSPKHVFTMGMDLPSATFMAMVKTISENTDKNDSLRLLRNQGVEGCIKPDVMRSSVEVPLTDWLRTAISFSNFDSDLEEYATQMVRDKQRAAEFMESYHKLATNGQSPVGGWGIGEKATRRER